MDVTSFPIVLKIPVAWGEMDAFAHVNNVVYFRYFESARIAYFERMGIHERGAPEAIGPILANTSCRFRAPLSYPDRVDVCARVRAIGIDRFTMEYAVVSERLARVAASGEGVLVSFDYAAAQKTELPAAWRERIVEIERSVGHAF